MASEEDSREVEQTRTISQKDRVAFTIICAITAGPLLAILMIPTGLSSLPGMLPGFVAFVAALAAAFVLYWALGPYTERGGEHVR